MAFLLPATVYQPPGRPARGHHLNTIIEDHEDTKHGLTNANAASQFSHSQHHTQQRRTHHRGPPSVVSSEGDEDEYDAPHSSSHSSCAASDAGTALSESCPSLTYSHGSEAASLRTSSSQNSTSNRHSRNRYPALLIPRGEWSLDGNGKQLPLSMSASGKLRLSPEALDRLSRHVPSINHPPSLGDASSIRSESPSRHIAHGVPPTPDLHDSEPTEGQPWGQLDTPLEIALDDEESILLSAAEAHSAHLSASTTRSMDWNDLVHRFPLIPGATPIETTPVDPFIPRHENFDVLLGEPGVALPAQALELLQTLNMQVYSGSVAGSVVSEHRSEMQQLQIPQARPQSWSLATPVSAISDISIPSPGGFFSSLKADARSTWCMPGRKQSPPPPTSTTAENFYNTPWNQAVQIKETVLEWQGDAEDDLPTVRQPTFDLPVSTPKEDTDLYGGSQDRAVNYEYEESYADGLMTAAGANLDRTSHWLAAQDDYISSLRDSVVSDDVSVSEESLYNTEAHNAIDFLQKAKAAASPELSAEAIDEASSPAKETTFLQAFTYQKSETKRSDAFLHATSRLDSVSSSRIALPGRHVQSLLNNHTSKTLEPEHARPKYRGPFSQNPRATGDFSSSDDQSEYGVLERQQAALRAVQPNMWALDAQRSILYNGRLMANRAASERLTQKDADAGQAEQPGKPNKRRPKVLDLAGAATASWAWAAAAKWPNTTIYTVQTSQQAELAQNNPAPGDVEHFRPDTPANHKIMSVPQLWQLPFPDSHFDVISARTLHMHVRAKPVPGVESINEWDLTLKECMRVLRPGGVLDYFVMDSSVSMGSVTTKDATVLNLSPSNMSSSNGLPTPRSARFEVKRADVATEFKNELERRGYEADGGCGQLIRRLKQEGFKDPRRQYIGLPMGQSNGAIRNTFLSAPRPVSDASTIAGIIAPYADVEAVQGPVGTTASVSDMSALLGELLWEEWLVRLRIESGRHSPEDLLDGVDEQFSEWRRSGKAAWRAVIGWARKPTRKENRPPIPQLVDLPVSNTMPEDIYTAAMPDLCQPARSDSSSTGYRSAGAGFLPTVYESDSHDTTRIDDVPRECRSVPPAGVQRRASIRRSRQGRPSRPAASKLGLSINTNITYRRTAQIDWNRRVNEVHSMDFTMSAVERGEVGEIPMMIME